MEVKMLKLYITRHGETVWNTQRRMQGWKNSELTERGIANAKALGDSIKEIEFKRVYCSPLDRTRKTAELILGTRNIEVIYEEDLKEINLGEIEGSNQEEANKIHPNFSQYFWEQPHLYEALSGEDFYKVRERVIRVLEKIIKENPEGNVLIVTHGVVLKTIQGYFKNTPMENFWAPPFIYDTSLTIVEIDKGTAEIVVEGDISHLKHIEI
jgi:probable phosphoglycerate mutase